MIFAKREFLKIIDDYYIQIGDNGQLFSMKKPSDIRNLIYILNKKQGYDEVQCEYNVTTKTFNERTTVTTDYSTLEEFKQEYINRKELSYSEKLLIEDFFDWLIYQHF